MPPSLQVVRPYFDTITNGNKIGTWVLAFVGPPNTDKDSVVKRECVALQTSKGDVEVLTVEVPGADGNMQATAEMVRDADHLTPDCTVDGGRLFVLFNGYQKDGEPCNVPCAPHAKPSAAAASLDSLASNHATAPRVPHMQPNACHQRSPATHPHHAHN